MLRTYLSRLLALAVLFTLLLSLFGCDPIQKQKVGADPRIDNIYDAYKKQEPADVRR